MYNDWSRFTNLKPVLKDDILYARESIFPVEGFGTVLITVTTLEAPGLYIF